MASLPEANRQGLSLGRGETCDETVTVVGRVVSAYQEGHRLAFWTLNDGFAEVQIALTPQRLSQEAFRNALAIKVGWPVQAIGPLSRSRRGALMILATEVEAKR